MSSRTRRVQRPPLLSPPVFDAVSSGKKTPSASALTWSHTCGAAASILLVFVDNRNHGGTGLAVSYNGVALTQLTLHINTKGNVTTTPTDGFGGTVWVLNNPAVGAHTVSVSSPGSDGFGAEAISYSNAQMDGNAVECSSGSPGVQSSFDFNSPNGLDSAAGNVIVAWAERSANADLFNSGPGITRIVNRDASIFFTNQLDEVPGAVHATMTWTFPAANLNTFGVGLICVDLKHL